MVYVSGGGICTILGASSGLGALAWGSEMSARDWSRIMASTDPERERRNYHGRASLVVASWWR